MELSVIIPNRNGIFTNKTIEDVLSKAGVEVEVVVNVDEKYPDPVFDDKRIVYIHPSEPKGMRQAINSAIRVAKGKYVMKSDDHCMFAPDFGKTLIEEHKENNWVQIPRRYALNAEDWKIEERTDHKYPIDYMYIDFPRKGKAHDDGMHGVPWRERREQNKDLEMDDTPSLQGSCWFMTKDYFQNVLGEMSEEGYGQFSQEAQEIGFKTWLGGGAMKVNKKTWYAHLYKGKRYGRMYHVKDFNRYTKEASEWSADYWLNNKWKDRVHDFKWFIDEKFPGMPSWPENWEEEIRKMGWVK